MMKIYTYKKFTHKNLKHAIRVFPYLLFILFSSITYTSQAQWVNVGTPGFSAGRSTYQSLAFNGSTPYVAYRDQGNGSRTTVMKFDGSNWLNVGSPGFSAGDSYHQSLAFNGSTPYVAYQDDVNGGGTTVMKFDGLIWVNVGIPGFSAGQATYQSLAFNGNIPYVAFSDQGNGSKTTVMKFDGFNWVNVGAAGFTSDMASLQSLAFDGSTPYVSFQNGSFPFSCSVMKFNGANWEYVGSPDISTGTANYIQLALNGSTPYVAYQDAVNGGDITVKKFDGINWVSVGVPGFSAGQAHHLSLALNNNSPYIAYQDWANGFKATVMKFDGSNWVNFGTPGFSAGSAVYLSLAFTGNIPYLAYMDSFNEDKTTVMKFADTACMTILRDTVFCDSTGTYIYEFQICNNSNEKSIEQIEITVDSPGPPNYVVTVPSVINIVPPLSPQAASQVYRVKLIGPGSVAYTEVCYTLSAHFVNDDCPWCCYIENCIKLPLCGCAEVIRDSVYCSNDQYFYDFKLQNGTQYNVTKIQVTSPGVTPVTFVPQIFHFVTPILPGQMFPDLTAQILGGVAGLAMPVKVKLFSDDFECCYFEFIKMIPSCDTCDSALICLKACPDDQINMT
ncbi:MAG: hypothetical protein IPL53_05650 [Ignavibacteria bacterium]|nr:hypothetical protein [Ignavibacteria bacterium]